MADAPIISIDLISLTFGGNPLFSEVSAHIMPGERIALVGRNGEGKSTLLKCLAGQVEVDDGQVVSRAGVGVAYLEQDPNMSGFSTLGEFASHKLSAADRWRAEAAAEGLDVPWEASSASASGGEKRRAALAAALAADADLMLLDEPTNHLDINAILWLEQELRATKKAFVLISHDRTFLSALTRRTYWLDRGRMRVLDRGFDRFEAWRDEEYEKEALDKHKLDRFLKAEGRWAVEGISARRKRNMGRVRRLHEAREARANSVAIKGQAKLQLDGSAPSGKIAIEARSVSKVFGNKVIAKDFSIRIARGDRIAVVGPNGVGKTTLIEILTGAMPPDSGSVKLGLRLEMATFDQAREQIAGTTSLWSALTEDPIIGASGKNDQVIVRGKPRHVVSYLKDFLFDEAQARGPVSALSGGERARLHLARIMAQTSNLLVLDEPTNDLDIETLDVLQEAIDGYDGTVILISHDRDFVDRVVTATLAMEGDGRIVVHAGGYSDYLARREPLQQSKPATTKPREKKAKAAGKEPVSPRLSFTEEHRLEELPNEIAALEKDIERLTSLLSAPDLFEKEPVKFEKATRALAERQERLFICEEEWLALAEKAEAS